MSEESSFINQNTIKVSLLDESSRTGVKYGLNWGFDPESNELRIEKGKTETSRSGNESYLQLPTDVYKSDFFPEDKSFLITDDKGNDFLFSRSQPKVKDGKPQALSTSESNRIFGLYFRHRLGLKSGQLITKQDLLNYGRTDILFKKENGNYYLDFSSSKKLNSENLKNPSSSSIPHPRNRIIFGAPGTGKSFRLNRQCEKYFNEEIKLDEEKIVAREIQNAKNDYSASFAIGLNHSEFFKNIKQANEISAKYDCGNKAYSIYQGIRAKDFYDSLPELDFNENEDEIIEKIKTQFENLKNKKYLLQAGAAAIGFKYSDFLGDKSKSELNEIFDFTKTSSESTWIKIGVQGANYSFDKTSTQQKTSHYERVTFHPNYTYSQFVGTYKPTMKTVQTDDGEKEEITYSFVPGPFLRVYVNAVKNPEPFLLLIEEINRANVAAVFGDVFQLLDRDENGKSEYPVAASDDIRKYLKSEGIDQTELSIPQNMYIWATMNSADQGVFPMDTAFKRRWNFEYIGIDEEESGVATYKIPLNKTTSVNWNSLRKAINNKLIDLGVNEDKLLGPYFISENDLKNADDSLKKDDEKSKKAREDFINLSKSKVIMYLFEDAAKMKKEFFNCGKYIYSEICKELDENGLEVFNFLADDKEKVLQTLKQVQGDGSRADSETSSE